MSADGADLLTDDSEDEDFVPDEHEEEGGKPEGGRESRSRSVSNRKRTTGMLEPVLKTGNSSGGFMELEDEDRGTVDAQGSSGGGGEGLQAEPAKDGGAGDGQASQDPGTEDVEEDREERYNPRKAARKAKIEAIWESLKRDGQFCGRKSCAPSSAGVLQTANFGGAAKLSSGYKAGMSLASLCQPVKDVPPSVDPDKHWMAGLGMGKMVKMPGLDKSAAQAALEAVKLATSITAAERAGKVAITEKRNFAGKEVEVTKEVSKESVAKIQPRSGLDAMLASLQGSKKISVLDKSRDDWRSFKTSDTAVEEELETYKKSGDKYLDKQEFLKKAELREYEIERDQRLASDIRTRGRV